MTIKGTTARRPVRGRTSPSDVPPTFYQDIVTSLRNSVLAILRDGRLAVINDAAYRALGIAPSDCDLGRPYQDVLRACPDVVRILNGAFELSALPNRAELRLKTTGKVIGYTLCVVHDASGQATGAMLLFKDLTRVEQLEERERLRDRLATLGEMAAAIAHEVKNPLAAIEVLAGLLKRRVPDSTEAQSLLNDIIHEAKMANGIVLEVLEYVRPIRLQVESVSMARVVDEAVALAESTVQRGATAVSIDLQPDLPSIDGDAHQLRQLLGNLVINAFEALNGGGRVTIAARHVPAPPDPVNGDAPVGPGTVEINVTDDGPGVPDEVRERIFSPFFTTKPRGSGLGLSIVRKIVDVHDGHIDLRMAPGGGTRFQVTLPVAAIRDEPGADEAA
jgi:two-component system nitrogen regulation sensor histidine kinase GlnL